MKCPYCGAEVTSIKCEYCNSDLSELINSGSSNIKIKDTSRIDKLSGTYLEKIQTLCKKIQKQFPDYFSVYDENRKLISGKGVKDKLIKVLNIDNSEQIYLIHDDTLFQNGGNGFAITSSAFHCKELLGGLVVTKFDEIEADSEIACDNTKVYIADDNITLAYLTGGEKPLKATSVLCEDIFNILLNKR